MVWRSIHRNVHVDVEEVWDEIARKSKRFFYNKNHSSIRNCNIKKLNEEFLNEKGNAI